MIKRRKSRFDGGDGEFEEVEVSAPEYERYKLEMKEKLLRQELRKKFRNSFISSGVLLPKGNLKEDIVEK